MLTRPINALAAIALTSALAWAPAAAVAQTKLKWAHVYEIAEPYHTDAVWAGEEIKKRTNGKYEIQVFPASQLGNENQINEALGLGTVDMIYTGVALAPTDFVNMRNSGAGGTRSFMPFMSSGFLISLFAVTMRWP